MLPFGLNLILKGKVVFTVYRDRVKWWVGIIFFDCALCKYNCQYHSDSDSYYSLA